MEYDPLRKVDPEAWNAIDESERLAAVVRYHKRKRIRMPNVNVHAAIHTAVENQIAEGDAFPAKAALARLMNEGLDRHEAVHAIGSVVAGEIFRVIKEKMPSDQDDFKRRIEQLTAESWRKQFSDSE